MIFTFLAHAGGAFGFFIPSHTPPSLPKQSVVVNTISEHPTAPPALPSSAQISLGSQKSVGSTTTPVRNLYNLSTPTSENPYGCYEQRGDTVVVHMQEAATPETKVLPNADVQTFQDLSIFDLCFGKDKDNVYFYDQVLQWADPQTFIVLAYFRGSGLFLRNGDKIISWRPDANNSQEISTDCTPGISGGFCDVAGGDANTFELISGAYDIAPWAKDKNNVYCAGRIIQGSDPLTVQTVNNALDLRVVVSGTPSTYHICQRVDASI
jgi:DKNYY family